MASANTQVGLLKECTARPKHAKKVKYPRVGRRTLNHVRMGFSIAGLDREVTRSDIDDQIELSDTPVSNPHRNEDVLISLLDGEQPEDDKYFDLLERRLEFLRWAISELTERQAIALGYMLQGASEYEGAEAMNVKQPTFHETLYGKDGKGGVIKKLRKLVAKYPITLS
ncbi:MAG TPA: hypothetical protein VGL38_08175 [bacterium]|jgi:hypothetical protein